MTNEEAIEILKHEHDYAQLLSYVNEALKIAISSIEKQISKKPIRANRAVEKDGQLFMNDDNEYWKCPTCTLYDVPLRENQKYCHYCGQAIDWSDTECIH